MIKLILVWKMKLTETFWKSYELDLQEVKISYLNWAIGYAREPHPMLILFLYLTFCYHGDISGSQKSNEAVFLWSRSFIHLY